AGAGAWSWLPLGAAKRSVTSGSLTLVAFPRLRSVPILAITAWHGAEVAHCASEFAPGDPFSQSCASRIGPVRSSLALKARWTFPKLPLHGLLPLLLQATLPPGLRCPAVSSHESSISTGPSPGFTGIGPPLSCQTLVDPVHD